ncbi:MAG: citrate synthase [Lachnospiraceae bacterium]|nr:citrate synthase [Lachnospiraceae bacterium]
MHELLDLKSYSIQQEEMCRRNDYIDPAEYPNHNVKRGLRDVNGVGVVAGLTQISKIVSFDTSNGERIPCEGQLWYRGYNVEGLVEKYAHTVYGYEHLTYLLLFGTLPSEEQAEEFIQVLGNARALPERFARDIIMKAASPDIMNSITRSILSMASYDENVQSLAIDNVIRQCIQLIAVMPMLAIYGYHASNHYNNDGSMYIHRPAADKSTAENILMLLRPDKNYSEIEAKALDTALMLHMEHGGGNNSSFTTRVVTSAGSDTYATMAAAMSSLKGPRHGGANIKVMTMMDDIRANVKDWEDEEELSAYLEKILNKQVGDKSGLIYGMGHAVYSLSDPREKLFRAYVEQLSEEKGRQRDMKLYQQIEKLAPEVIARKCHIYKGVSPNVDFYSGFAYEMLGIPRELYTPIFAIARLAGWSAHRLEELVGQGKIIRPAYTSVMVPVEL